MATTTPKIASVLHDEKQDEEKATTGVGGDVPPEGQQPQDGENVVAATRNPHYRPLLISAIVFEFISIIVCLVAVIFVLIGTYPIRCFCNTRIYWLIAWVTHVLATILYSIAVCCCLNKPTNLDAGEPGGGDFDKTLRRIATMSSILVIILFGVSSPFVSTLEHHSVAGYILAMFGFMFIIPFVTSLILLTRRLNVKNRTGRNISTIFSILVVSAILVVAVLLVIGAVVYDTSLPIDDYPDCYVKYDTWIGDGICDGRAYATEECGYDGGDCHLLGESCDASDDCASELCKLGVCVE